MASWRNQLRDNLRRGARIAVWLGALAVTCWLGLLFYGTFHQSVAAINAAGAGSATAPYSDALGPWLDSSLSYYLRGVPLNYLYRPTIGLFYSTIISVTSSIASIPIAWIALFFAGCGGLFAASDWPDRTALIGVLGACAIFFVELIGPLNPATLMVDFWPMAMCLLGIWLIGLGENGGPRALAPTLAGFLVLGIGACVRGPQLASGAAILVLLAPSRIQKRAWLPLLLMTATFLAPFVVDSIIQKRNGIADQSIIEFYSFYTDPAHHWSMPTHRRFLSENPSAAEVHARYLRFLFGAEGRKIFLSNCGSVISQTADLMINRWFLLMLATLALVGWLAGQSTELTPSPSPSWRWAKRLTAAGAIIAAGAMLCVDPATRVFLFTAFVAALGLHALLTGRRLTAMLIVAFYGALALHAALGLLGGARLIVSYEILLVAAMASAVTERARPQPLRPALLRGLARSLLVLVLIGYTGNFWIRTGYKAKLRAQLAAPQTAVKISNSQELNLSLYLKGDGGVFYTRYDPAPFGTVRRYEPFATPDGIGCVTYVNPCVVTWDSPLPVPPVTR
jgi:hypothetical protein